MANPQKEDGHVDIANQLVEQLARTRLPGEEWQLVWVIFRKTWGWHKKFDRISQTQFAKATGIKRRRVWAILQRLVAKNIIIKKDDSFIRKYGIQKDWEKWKLSPKKVIVSPKKMIPIIKNDDKTVTKKGEHKRKKEKITKETIESVFAYWQKTFDHSRAKLTKDRKTKIASRLKEGYSLDDLKHTIDGCKNSSYHMGENDQGKIFDSIELLFRNGDKVESFWQYTKNGVTSDIKVQLSKACAELGKLAGKKRILKWLLILPENYHSRLSQFLDRAYRQGHSYSEAKDEWRKRQN